VFPKRRKKELSQHLLVIETQRVVSAVTPENKRPGGRFNVELYQSGDNPGLQWRLGAFNGYSPLPYLPYKKMIFVSDQRNKNNTRMRVQALPGGNASKPIEYIPSWDQRLAFYAAAAEDMPGHPLVNKLHDYLTESQRVLAEAVPVIGRLLSMKPEDFVDVVASAPIELEG